MLLNTMIIANGHLYVMYVTFVSSKYHRPNLSGGYATIPRPFNFTVRMQRAFAICLEIYAHTASVLAKVTNATFYIFRRVVS